MWRTLGAEARCIGRNGWRLLIGAALALSCASHDAAAQAPAVVAGHATVASKPGATIVEQSTEKAILNWPSLSVPAGNLLQFVQPDSAAIALNRVLGGTTHVDGSLVANGRVWIINPNGVLFGANASVNVAGLIATTADIDNGDFLAGNNNFSIASTNPHARVANNGKIVATGGGAVVLAAPQVDNEGLIEARLGSVVLGGAKTFTVEFDGDKLLNFAVAPASDTSSGPGGKPAGARVSNNGTIRAAGGTVLLTARAARGVLDNVINTSGMIEATTAHDENGTIVLDAGPGGTANINGTLDVSGRQAGATGGTIKVLGGRVTLDADARIDAAGDAGGGTVLVGGNVHGAGPEPDATDTVVAAGARIDASAITNGNGGTVAVWANDRTVFDGAITVRGGAQGGNGGFVETSGHDLLAATTGTVDARAPAGTTGDWLLDPSDIVIMTGGTSSLGEADAAGDEPVDTAFDIDPSALQSANANVTLDAGDSITFASNVTMANTGVGITAEAGNAIIVDPGVTISTKGGAIQFVANDPANPAVGASGSGGITMAGALATNGGGASGGSVSLGVTGGSGAIDLAGNITTSGGAISLEGPVRLGTDARLDTTNGGAFAAGADIDVAGTVDGAETFSLQSGNGAITFAAAVGGGTPLAGVTATGGSIAFDATLAASGAINTTGATSTTFDGVVTAGRVATGKVALDGMSVTTTSGQSYGAVTLDDNILLSDSGGSAIDFTGLVFASPVAGERSLTIDDRGGAVSFAGIVTSEPSQLASLNATAASITFGSTLAISGAIDTTNVGLTTFDGNVTASRIATGAVALDGGSVTTTGAGQLYGAATLGADTRLIDASDAGVTFIGPVTGNADLSVWPSGSSASTATFDGAIDIGGMLDTALIGRTTFHASVMAQSVATGAAEISGGSVTTTGGQSYGAVTVDASTEFSTGSNMAFAGTVGGAGTVTVAAPTGTVTFDGPVAISGGLDTSRSGLTVFGDSVSATSVRTDAVALNGGSVTTAGGQSYGIADAGPGGGAATLGADTVLSDDGGAIDFDGTLDGAHALTIAESGGSASFAAAVGGVTPLSSLRATAATLIFDRTVTVSGTLDTSTVALSTFDGTITAGGIGTGGFTIAGDTTLAATGDITLGGASLFNNSYALDVLAQGNVTVTGMVQNAGSGGLTVVAGWDGVTRAAAVATTRSAYGLAGGSVVIGGSGATGSATLGSAGGGTLVAAANLTLDADNGFAQLGYGGGGATGAISATLTGALDLKGGGGAGDFAQIGHGGVRVGGGESGDISVVAPGNVTLAGGSGSDAYVQIGHGGAFSNADATAGFSDAGNIAVAGDVVTLAGGSGSGAYAQIGHGGLGAGQDASVGGGAIAFTGAIAIAAAGTLALSGDGPEAYAQIGNGGYQSVDGTNLAAGGGITEAGDITVTTGTSASAGALAMLGDAYAQIGNGGYAANLGASTPQAVNEFGTIDVTVNGGTALLQAGDTGAYAYAQIGNGDEAAVGVGNVAGNIAIEVATPVGLDSTALASAGMWNATGLGTVSGTTSVNGVIVAAPGETVAAAPLGPSLPPPSLIDPWLTTPSFNLGSNTLADLTAGSGIDSTASALNAITPSAGGSNGANSKGPIEAMTDANGGGASADANGATVIAGGGAPPGAAQEDDSLSSGIAHSLSGMPGEVPHPLPQAILVGGLLTEAPPPLTARETPRALEPADELYSSWGNDALWDWR